jgi:hypothetical protein
MRSQVCAAVAMLAVCAEVPATAQAPQADDRDIVIQSVWAGDGVCTEQNTIAVSLENLLRDQARYSDTCVSTVGFVGFRSLFTRAEDAAMPESSWSASYSDRRIGLYGNDQTTQDLAGARQAQTSASSGTAKGSTPKTWSW